VLLILLLVVTPAGASAQSARSLVREGNGEYNEGRYPDAEVAYRKALEEESRLLEGHFNLGNSLHRQGKYDEAVRAHQQAIGDSRDPRTKADAHFNIGNSELKAGKYREAADAYVEALKLNPDDQDAKYNLSYALRMQQQQQNRQQDQGGNDDRQDQDKQQQQQQNKQNQQRENQERPPQSRDRTMSRADAERILDVLKNTEKDIQKRLRARQAVRPKGEKDW
jgi:tetratricopeptide (TPR) repeat protein